MAHVYILKTESGRYYIGSTTDLPERLKHHESGFTPSTKRMGDVNLIFSQEYLTLKEARLVESKLKKLKRRDYIEKIIADGRINIQP